ncbi:MAG: MFS family permease [Halocynthiibacter sp.]|jgi:MFS family permease
MLQVLKSAWPLLLGMMLLMVGNGMQGTLLGVRGGIEEFSTFSMSVVMSAYFVGFLGGSRLAPEMIRRVGHVRVFAALGSFISAVLILYPTVTEPWAWSILRVVIGFSFSGVYVTAESWLNNAASNQNRGKALSLYMMVQMIGIIAAQGILAVGEPSGYILFVIPSVLVSISFAPILLSVNPTPAFESTKRMDLPGLWSASPLGCVGIFLMGGVFSAQFGMAAVYGTIAGLSVGEISAFVAVIYVGAVVLQYPIGWLSDRMDRRLLILIVAAVGAVSAGVGIFYDTHYAVLLGVAFMTGGAANPLYSLLIAYTNDFLEPEDMAAASAGLLFINGVGAIAGPLLTGWLMGAYGPGGFWLLVSVLMLAVSIYAGWRMTRRPAMAHEDTSAYVSVLPTAGAVAMEVAQEWAIEHAEAEEALENAAQTSLNP